MTKLASNPKNPLAAKRQVSAQGFPQKKVASNPQGRRASSEPVGVPTGQLRTFETARDERLFDGDGQVNPGRFQGHGRKASTSDRVYNAQGEINAYDRRDAVAQAVHAISEAARGNPLQRLRRQASASSQDDQKRRILAAAFQDPSGEGFRRVAADLALPIKMIMDYEGWIRKIFRVRTLGQSELFRIPRDIRAPAQVLGQDGQGVQSVMGTTYVTPDEAILMASFKIPLMELHQVNFDILDRAQETARQSLQLEEDKRGLRLLDRASEKKNAVTGFATVSLAVFENLRYQVERHRLLVDKFLINRAEMVDVQVSMSGSLDPVSQRELNLAGYFGRWLGAYMLTCAGTGVEEVLPTGTMFAVTAPDYLGEMGIRIPLFSEAYSDIAQGGTSKGVAFIESCGFGMPSALPVAKAERS